MRACGRELSCVLIFGTFLSFCAQRERKSCCIFLKEEDGQSHDQEVSHHEVSHKVGHKFGQIGCHGWYFPYCKLCFKCLKMYPAEKISKFNFFQTCSCTTFIIVAKPTDFSCGVMRFLIGGWVILFLLHSSASILYITGFCYTLCYAAVVTKTNRISRIFAAKVFSVNIRLILAMIMVADLGRRINKR